MNRFSSIFREDMDSGQLRTAYLAICDKVSDEDKPMLDDAYFPLVRKVRKKEFEYFAANEIMTSF